MDRVRKIKVTAAVPVGPEHGITAGRLMEVDEIQGNAVVVMGDAGERVKLLRREYQWVDDAQEAK